MNPQDSVFTQRRVVFALATLCCLLWGSSYPAIKSGYALFGIVTDDIPSKLVFAGWRFLFAGLVLMAVAAAWGRRLFALDRTGWRQVATVGLLQTGLQYVFFYIGLAHTTGLKGSIMNGTVTFFSVLLAHFIYRNDRLNARKVLGCLAGFGGVMVVNVGGDGLRDFDFTLIGEGFVVIAAFILSAAGIYGKKVSQRIDSVVLTAWQLAIGGAALLLGGYGFGGRLGTLTPESAALLGYLVLLSAAAFSLWTLLLQHNRVSLVTVFNFMVPVFGALLSALFLGERLLEWKNALALLLVCGGIWWVTREERAPSVPAVPSVTGR